MCILKSYAQEYDFKIQWLKDQAISLTIFNEEFKELFISIEGKKQKIVGKLSVDKNTRFTPIFPFTVGLNYEVFHADTFLFTFSPIRVLQKVELVKIFPLKDTLPENFLKFYLHFDMPMAAGHEYEHLQLLQEGQVIENAFVPLKPALWDLDKKILTLWIDPGRIKKELGSHLKYGSVLKEGNTYELHISKEMKAVNGAQLQKDFRKFFYVSKKDNEIPTIKNWNFCLPEINTRDSLILNFSESMDLATQYFISFSKAKTEIKGQIKWLNDNKIQFTPNENWKKGAYKIIIAHQAEDLAGNNLTRVFDRDLQKQKEIIKQKSFEIPFHLDLMK